MVDIWTVLGRLRLVPVVVLDDPTDARPLADALAAGGLPVAEVTLRTSAALDAIRIMAEDPGLLVGAGTVVRPAQAEAAVAAGARFVVSPGLSSDVVHTCAELGVPVLPGTVTPSELMAAAELGCEVVKFFPAETYGGAAALRALAGPFPGVRFVPTGGIGPANLADYLAQPRVLAVGGSWMVAPALFSHGDFSEVTSLTAAAVAAVRSHSRQAVA